MIATLNSELLSDGSKAYYVSIIDEDIHLKLDCITEEHAIDLMKSFESNTVCFDKIDYK